jgi:transcriptional regulator with XRE-family HTH domain
MTELARAMGISVSQVYRVREGKRNIKQKFIIGAMKAFPEYSMDDLFYLTSRPYEKLAESVSYHSNER